MTRYTDHTWLVNVLEDGRLIVPKSLTSQLQLYPRDLVVFTIEGEGFRARGYRASKGDRL